MTDNVAETVAEPDVDMAEPDVAEFEAEPPAMWPPPVLVPMLVPFAMLPPWQQQQWWWQQRMMSMTMPAPPMEPPMAATPPTEIIELPLVRIPMAAKRVFELFGDRICQFCTELQNIECKDGRVVRVFCESCRVVVNQDESSRCPNCPQHRYVEATGAIAKLCTECHQHERLPRRRRRRAAAPAPGPAGVQVR